VCWGLSRTPKRDKIRSPGGHEDRLQEQSALRDHHRERVAIGEGRWHHSGLPAVLETPRPVGPPDPMVTFVDGLDHHQVADGWLSCLRDFSEVGLDVDAGPPLQQPAGDLPDGAKMEITAPYIASAVARPRIYRALRPRLRCRNARCSVCDLDTVRRTLKLRPEICLGLHRTQPSSLDRCESVIFRHYGEVE
jgi:hypothetical protein